MRGGPTAGLYLGGNEYKERKIGSLQSIMFECGQRNYRKLDPLSYLQIVVSMMFSRFK